MKTSAQMKASAKYRKEKRDTVSMELPKGTRDIWKARAQALGLSLTAYIVSLVNADLSGAPADLSGIQADSADQTGA